MVKQIIKQYKWYLLALIFLVIGECLLVGFIGWWREFFWDAVEKKELHNFFVLIAQFTGAALGICIISGYTTYLISFISLLIRTDLTKKALKCPYDTIEGGEQRVQEDCHSYPYYGLSLLVNTLRNILILGTFAVIIVIQVGATYLWIPVVYTMVGTGVACKIALPLIRLNYDMQVVESAFRRWVQKRTWIKYSDVFTKLEFMQAYYKVFKVNKNLFITTKKLSYFQSFYNQITVIVPYLILFSLYFSGKIVFGVFMQVASSMNHVIDSLSYIINSFNDINNWLSCRRRLKELGVLDAKNKTD